MHAVPFHRGRSTFNSLNYVLKSVVIQALPHQGLNQLCFSQLFKLWSDIRMPELNRDRGSLSAPDRSGPTWRRPRARWDSWPWCQVHGFAKDAASIPYLDCQNGKLRWMSSLLEHAEGTLGDSRDFPSFSFMSLALFLPCTHPCHPYGLVIKQSHLPFTASLNGTKVANANSIAVSAIKT